MTDPTHAFVTNGGIYMVSDGRWAKVTALRAGRVAAGWGDMQGLRSLRRANSDAPMWMECAPEDIQLGDCARFVSRDFWASCTPVQAIITGGRVDRIPEDIAGRDLLIFTNSAAFRIQDGNTMQLLDLGRRKPATAADLTPHMAGACAIGVTSDTGA